MSDKYMEEFEHDLKLIEGYTDMDFEGPYYSGDIITADWSFMGSSFILNDYRPRENGDWPDGGPYECYIATNVGNVLKSSWGNRNIIRPFMKVWNEVDFQFPDPPGLEGLSKEEQEEFVISSL